MFGFGKQKKVDEEKIKGYKWALEAANIYMLISEWDKSRKAITEIKVKEKASLDELLIKIDAQDSLEAENEKIKLTTDYKKKEWQLIKLEHTLDIKEKKYNDHIEKEKFKIRFKKIKDEIENLIWNTQPWEAMWLLQKFLEENADNNTVVNFFNHEKKYIQKNIERQKKTNEDKFKDNAKMQAMRLIWNSVNLNTEEEEKKKEEKMNFIQKLKVRFNFYNKIKEKIRKKKLLDEINLLIDEDSKVKQDLAEEKLANIHKWLTKEIKNREINGYDLYGKILWSDKISWDTFGFNDSKDKYNFFIWDATGHGIRAGLIVTLLSRLFTKNINNTLQKISYEINNGLKQDLKSRNFITGIFFELKKNNPDLLNFVWMWHEPMYIYRKKEKKIETVIPGGLAWWIRMIKELEDVKVKEILMETDDILLMYSDGIIENKNNQWEFYGMPRLKESFAKIADTEKDITKIYEYIINDVQLFKWGSFFEDDVTLLVLKRDIEKDIITENSDYLQDITTKQWLTKQQVKKLEWKTKDEIELELEKYKKDKDTLRIVKVLEWLYYTWEILKLKQEAVRYIKQWYIHKKINYYLKKAIDNETKYKVDQKNQKMSSKYLVLTELSKKWDFTTVINEIEDVISKDGNI
jgi:serine phosphatase RsbU (regulator of sigma subunit)